MRNRRATLEARRAETGRILAETLGGLRGVYTKIGQHLAHRADLLPDEIRSELESLDEAASALPLESILETLERSLGPLHEHFESIEAHPVGSASVAQVHRARLLDGSVVAVKVRHPDLTQRRIERDLRTLRRLTTALRPWLRGQDVAGLLEEAGRGLREELDFEREGRTAEEIAAHLAHDPRVVVPRVHWRSTSPEVLTLDYVPRVRLDDPAGLEARGVSAAQCMAILADAYGLQIFAHGLFHADPHAGNLFAVDERDPLAPPGDTRPRVLFVDFGLSKRLDEGLRSELRLGLQALLRRDARGILDALGRVGALIPGREDQAAVAMSEVLDAGAAGALGADESGIGALKELGKRLVRESRAFRIPPDLVLYARTLAYVFSFAERVAPGTNPMPYLLPHLLRFLSH